MALFDQPDLFLCLDPWIDLTLTIEGTMTMGIMSAAMSKLCIVIWMDFIELLRSFLFL